jgi:hypothetical protein
MGQWDGEPWRVGLDPIPLGPVHLPEPAVEPVRAWCGAQREAAVLAAGHTPTVLLHNEPEYLRAHVTCPDCKALDERTRHGLPSEETALLDASSKASLALRARIKHAATLAINAVYGEYMADRVADFVIDGKPLPWTYPPGTGEDPAVEHRPTTPVQCSCGWRETDAAGERTWAEHMAAAIADLDGPPVHYNPDTGEAADLR